MKQQGILHTIADGVRDACHIWYDELRLVLKDEGVLIFFVIVPLIYPLLYSWIYNNETVREVPVVVVDDSHSAMSRQFIRMCDASPDVQIKYYASDIDEAQMLMGRQIVKAIYRIPADFESNLMRMQQSVVSVYCDMSLMLTYKAAYQTALAVSQTMNKEIQIQLAGRYTKREEQIQAAPLQCDDVALYNPGGGYGSAILPAVLMLILQQTLVLGIGMAAGTARETNRFSDLVPIQSHYHGTFRIVLGKAMAYFMIYAVMGTWLTVVVPRLFNFPHLAQWYNLLMLMLPYTLACIFFGITVSCLVRYRENVMLLMVFVSIPLLFLSGASWPQSAIPGFWQGISWLFPSTFGVRAYVRLNSMGGSIGDVLTEYQILWLHVLIYFVIACLVYRRQIQLACRHAEEATEE
jgi:ABC-2 type transport system permease protein